MIKHVNIRRIAQKKCLLLTSVVCKFRFIFDWITWSRNTFRVHFHGLYNKIGSAKLGRFLFCPNKQMKRFISWICQSTVVVIDILHLQSKFDNPSCTCQIIFMGQRLSGHIPRLFLLQERLLILWNLWHTLVSDVNRLIGSNSVLGHKQCRTS